MKKSQIISGIIAIGIYLFVVTSLIFYLSSKSDTKSKKYVKKSGDRVVVSLALEKDLNEVNKKIKPIHHNKVKAKPKAERKREPIKRVHKKKIVKKPKHMKHSPPKKINKKITKKEPKIVKPVLKKKVVKKVIKKDVNLTKKPRVKKVNLFDNISVKKRANILIVSDKPIKSVPTSNLIKVKDKPVSAMDKIEASKRAKRSQKKGVSNLYLARVQEILEDWPAQSDFAGESVKVLLYIKPDGMFDFDIKSASKNVDFNRALVDYLKQLQMYGFGSHDGNRVYRFEAEFVAKE